MNRLVRKEVLIILQGVFRCPPYEGITNLIWISVISFLFCPSVIWMSVTSHRIRNGCLISLFPLRICPCQYLFPQVWSSMHSSVVSICLFFDSFLFRCVYSVHVKLGFPACICKSTIWKIDWYELLLSQYMHHWVLTLCLAGFKRAEILGQNCRFLNEGLCVCNHDCSVVIPVRHS
jgi:hypothetical protein